MNIIFGQEKTELLKEKYTVLELDTFLVNGQEIKAYCTLEQISLSQLSQIDPMRTLHHTLIKSYGQQDWKTCLDLLHRLRGFWNGELDTFYDELHTRVEKFMNQAPDPTWTPVIVK